MLSFIAIIAILIYILVSCHYFGVEFITGEYRALILSPHKTHNILKTNLPKFPFKVIIRLGWKWYDRNMFKSYDVEINSVESIGNAADKLRMKLCFDKGKVKTANWSMFNESINKFPVVAKHRWGSRGTGNYMLRDKYEFKRFVEDRKDDLELFIFEDFLDYTLEYRLHVTKQGCFYTNRKALRNNVDSSERWKFSYNNTVWLKEENENFKKPNNWDEIAKESVKALISVGLDIGAVDVKYNPKNDKFFIIEINSAASFGDFTAQEYLKELPKLIMSKHGEK